MGTATARAYRILVVEDNLDAVHSTCMLLRDMGHVADFAINGYVAVYLAKRYRPDFVVLDIGLPGLSGLDVAGQIKSDISLAHVRIVVLTAYDRPDYRERAEQLGCETFLVKPVDPAELVRIFGEPAAQRIA